MKKQYVKPEIRTEVLFEVTALACGKCVSGPYPQFQCGGLLKSS
jgi:hypothetical protein